MEKVDDDWIGCLQTGFRKELSETILNLPLARLQKYPPPKKQGLPVGHEFRIFKRFINGRCSLLDPSGFSKLYSLSLSAKDKSVYNALVLGEPLTRAGWDELIGSEQTGKWKENRLLQEKNGKLACSFRLVSIAGRTLVVDPAGAAFPNRVYVGQDSIETIDFLARRKLPDGGRFLDVGTGSGAILMALSHGNDEAIGVEINPRAVLLAKFNAELNSDAGAQVFEEDIFTLGDEYGRFDLISWNVPFRFFPEGYRDANLDGYGGDMGIELTLRFVEEALPRLISEKGEAYLYTSAPVLKDNSNLLEEELKNIADRLNLDITIFMARSYWVKELQEFHERHEIKRFENVFLHIRRSGRGRLCRRNAYFASRPLDKVRRFLYGK